MQRKIPAQEINMKRIEGISLDSEAQTVYTVNGDGSHLENPISNENVRSTVQTCPEVTVNGCRVSMRFRNNAVPDLEHDVALMLLDIFRNRPDKE